MCHKYHDKHTSKECNLDRLKSGSKRNTTEMPTCAVPVHAPQTNNLWRGEEGGTTKAVLAKACGGRVCACCFVLLNQYWGIVMYGPGASS